MRCAAVFSDVHLSTVVRAPGPWMAYRRAEHLVDGHLAHAIDLSVEEAARARAHLEIILGGDFFDLDAPLEGSLDVDARSEAGAALVMQAILADHPVVTASLGRALAKGARVVFVPGNHDAQLAFESVRAAIRARLRAIVFCLVGPNVADERLRGLAFRSWFHRTPDGVHVEHGHVYDPFCTMTHLFPSPDAHGRMRLEDTLGTVGTRYVGELLGLVNPYSIDPLGDAPGKVGKALDCVGASPDEPSVYAAKIVAGLRDVLSVGEGTRRDTDEGWLAHVGSETQTPARLLQLHRAFWALKAGAGELASAAATEAYGYDRDTDLRLRKASRSVGRFHQVPVVVMGHTHEAFVEKQPDGRVHANSGTWAPLGGGEGETTGSRLQARDARERVGTFVWACSDRGRMSVRLRSMARDGTMA